MEALGKMAVLNKRSKKGAPAAFSLSLLFFTFFHNRKNKLVNLAVYAFKKLYNSFMLDNDGKNKYKYIIKVNAKTLSVFM